MAVDLSPGQIKENALRDGGFSDEEIGGWKSDTAHQLDQGGFSPKEVRDYFGQKEMDMNPTKAVVKANLATAKADTAAKPKREPIDVSPKPVEAKDMIDAMAAGWGNSITGLLTGKNTSPIAMPANASVAQSFVSNAAMMLGDAPAMAAGFVSGGSAGAGLGTATLPVVGTVSGAAVGAAAGAFAVPAAMRRILVDHYQKGDVQDAGDFARRVVDTTWEGTKGAITGAATAVTGGMGGALAGTAGKLSAEVVAQTTVSSALEGHLPQKEDFLHAAVAIGGLHAVGFGVGKAGYIRDKLMNIYAETGAHPNEIIEAANNDPHLKGQLLSQNPDMPIEANPPAPPEEPPIKGGDGGEPPKTDASRDEILNRIGESPEPAKLSIGEHLDKLYAKHLDYASVVKDVVSELGTEELNEKNAYKLMRLHAAVQDKVVQSIEVGTFDFKTGETNGESYMNIINDVKKMGPEAIDTFNAFRIAKRSLNYAKRGFETIGDQTNDKAYVDAHPEMQEYMDRYVSYRNRILDYLGASGRYSKESIQAMKDLGEDSYTPLKRVMEPDPITGKTPSNAKEIKKVIGSDRELIDPFESDIRDINNMIRLAHETEAMNTAIDNINPSPYIRASEDQQGPLSKTQIAKFVDGKRMKYDVPEEIAESVKAMVGNKPALSIWTKMLKPFATALRIGTVDNPLFAIRHAWRNQLTAPTLSETGLKPFEALLYAPSYLAKDEAYNDFIRAGGGVNSIIPLKDYADGKIYELNSKAPFLDQAWNKVKTAAEFSHWAIVMNDNMIRFAEYQRMLGKGATRTDAAFAAREVIPDFQKTGLQKSALQSITAFLNVHMQGQARMVQALKADFENFKAAVQGDSEAANKVMFGYIAKNLAYITVPSMLLAAAQSGDDAIDDLPHWQKYGYWPIHISDWREANSLAEAMSVKEAYPSNVRQMPDGKWQVNDGTIVRIQKPFTNGIFFGSAIEASLDAWKKKNPSAFGDFMKTVGGSVFAEPIPTALHPVLEQMVNRNFYTGQPIVRQSMENKLPEMQYNRYTSETAKALGKMISYVPFIRDIGPADDRLASPAVIENYIHGWGGTLGKYALDICDKGLETAGVVPKSVKPVSKLEDIPFVKEFVIRFPNARPQSVSDFEERYKKADQVHNSITQLLKEGDTAGAMKLQDRYAINMERLRGVDKAIENLNASIQKVNQNPDINPVEKRQVIDSFMYKMTSMAKQGNLLMDEFEKKVKTK